MKKILIIILLIPILGISQNFTNKFKTDSLEYRIDSTNTLLNQFTFADCNGVNNLNVKVCEPLNVVTDLYPITKQILDTLTEQNNILRTLNLGGSTVTNVAPSYTSNRTLLTANTTPAPYSVGIPSGTREITVQNVTGADIQITTSQGTQILGTRNNITLSNPLNTTISQTVFSGNITISFFSSVLGNISGVAPRVIIDFKGY